MGRSYYSDDDYKARASFRSSKGYKTAFVHDEDIASGKAEKKVHEKLDPKNAKMRESRDSDAHPVTVPVAVIMDTTGSMAEVPAILQKRLTGLMGAFLSDKASGKRYLGDGYPAIMIGAIDDYDAQVEYLSDGNGALQVGQFESGIEIDHDLERLWLTRNGGGTYDESYELAIYFMAMHTAHDHFEKRGRKGYLFLIGDEHAYRKISKKQVKEIIGDSIQEDMTLEQALDEVKERYHVFMIIPNMTNHYKDPALFEWWVEQLGQQNVLKLADPQKICDMIVAAVAICEEHVGIDDLTHDLVVSGAMKDALVPLSKIKDVAGYSASGLPDVSGSAGGTERL